MAPFEGKGGALVKAVMGKRRSLTNPLFCNHCEDMAKRLHAGVETEFSMLFADIRGSTPLAESMSAAEFKQLIDRFYTETTRVLTHSLAQIDKLAGDEVSGFYLPGYVGKDFVRTSVTAAQEILRVTGHADPEGPWAPVGVGVNTGEAYFGAVGTGHDMVEITALGDAVNVAARMESHGVPGEIHVSSETHAFAKDEFEFESRGTIEVKGKGPMETWWVRGRAAVAG